MKRRLSSDKSSSLAPSSTGPRPVSMLVAAWRLFQRSSRVLLVAGTTVVVCAFDFLVFETRPIDPPARRGLANVESGDDARPIEIVEGVWGRLEITPAYLEAPDALLDHAPMPDQRPVWRFPGWELNAVVELLRRAGLSESAIAEFQRPGAQVVSSDGVELLPSGPQLLQLEPSARQIIYEALAGSAANPFHRSPLTIFGDLDRWLSGCSLSAEQQALLRRMLWRRGPALAFSDVSALIAFATSASELREALRVMTRVSTLRASVQTGERVSSDAYLRYWTAEGRSLNVMPMVRALLEGRGAAPVDLALLLPDLGRERLYTFPSLADAVAGRLPDCNWTSLNFFVERPQPYYLESRPAYLALTQTYDLIERPALLGDVICFLSGDGQVIHSCVYIAGDLVFTKNGVNLWAPWVLMRLSDVAVIYGNKDATPMRTFRLKPRQART
ncbi:MAG: hypothetical protein JNL92_01070 [Opitutaceae bacterium]|nr:hypothetical protein [Opitutaceae bacterium]